MVHLLPVLWRPQVNNVYVFDALSFLRQMETGSVNCIVTSPPYFGLRDYGTDGQIGLEPTPDEYVKALVTVFREARRVLRDDGVFWLNLGDSYNTGTSNNHGKGGKLEHKHLSPQSGWGKHRVVLPIGYKQLLGIPFRAAFALQADGWILRADVIWHKPNPMPESVTDRPTKAHEYCFMFAKSPRYWYDAYAIREPNTLDMQMRAAKGHTRGGKPQGLDVSRNDLDRMRDMDKRIITANGRNKRSVWAVATKPLKEAHFAAFPPKLIEPMILSSCPPKVCANCGKPYRRIVERKVDVFNAVEGHRQAMRNRGVKTGGTQHVTLGVTDQIEYWDHGYAAGCVCHTGTVSGVILDPFMGAATTAVVAIQHDRNFIGCDLNPEYVNTIALPRIQRAREDREHERSTPITVPMFAEVA